jgi:hypothetical protein
MIYTTKSQAIERGYNCEGSYFGVPVWCEYDDTIGEMGCVEAKCLLLEPMLTIGAYFTQFCNWFRAPGEEFNFAFMIRPIE